MGEREGKREREREGEGARGGKKRGQTRERQRAKARGKEKGRGHTDRWPERDVTGKWPKDSSDCRNRTNLEERPL